MNSNAESQLNKQERLSRAICEYQQILQADCENLPAISHLAEIYEDANQLDQSIVYFRKIVQLQPDSAVARANLARIKLKLGDIEGAIATYIKALALPQPPVEVYQRLGDAFERNDEVTEAIVTYKNGIKLRAYNTRLYLRLMQLYLKRIPIILAEIKRKLISILQSEDDSVYLKIWDILNQPDLKGVEKVISFYSKHFDSKIVEQYFKKSSQYKIVDLMSLSEEDKQVIKNSDLSLEYLELNIAGLITSEGVVPEESSIQEFAEQLNIPQQVAAAIQRNRFQLSAIEEGRIYAVCPSTGKTLVSNRSIVVEAEGLSYTFYRFIGKEVFYLITGFCWLGFSKLFLYFPKKDLVVFLYSDSWLKSQDMANIFNGFNKFKTYIVTNALKVHSYFINPDKIQTASLISIQHFGHHLWNELSGVSKLHENDLLSKVDRFLVTSDPLGSLKDIFPEISSEKIWQTHKFESLSEGEILHNNYFVVRIGHNFIRENLVDRIYETSLKYCHPAFLAEVEEAKRRHFPLLWITVRFDNRTWISQQEGIVNIIRTLSEKFPNLGVVIDGFSLPHGFFRKDNFLSWIQETVNKETNTVKRIRSLLPTKIKIYDTIGCMMYESIIWANAVDLYLAHHGSIQHKIGWTANKPGLVHSNKQTLKIPIDHRAGSWERENGLIPEWISEEYVKDFTYDLQKPTHEMRVDLNNYDCDWKALYEQLFKLALSTKRK